MLISKSYNPNITPAFLQRQQHPPLGAPRRFGGLGTLPSAGAAGAAADSAAGARTEGLARGRLATPGAEGGSGQDAGSQESS